MNLRILSLGAGVQSTTMALMAAAGEIGPKPDAAIFADTGWEPRAVYEHLERLEKQLHNHFPVHRVTKGNIRDDAVNARTSGHAEYQGRWASMPWYIRNADGSGGMIRRQCTKEYKIEPIVKKQREMLGVEKGRRVPKGTTVEVWIGISTDEAMRVKPSQLAWQTNRWPLIEQGMSRWDCLLWMERNGYDEPPKSACVACPFRSDVQWRDLRDNHPEDWADAVEFDKSIRNAAGPKGETFTHRKMVPLDGVDLRTEEDKGQLNMFNSECEGMCGV